MGDHVLKPAPATVRLSPFGFFRTGRDFYRAACAYRPTEFSLVPYFLCCQAIELGFKAFLLLKGVKKRDLAFKPYGHNLVGLSEKARQEGIDAYVPITPEEYRAVAVANSFYDSDAARRRFQYFDVYLAATAYRDLPELSLLEATASKLVEDQQLKAMYLDAS